MCSTMELSYVFEIVSGSITLKPTRKSMLVFVCEPKHMCIHVCALGFYYIFIFDIHRTFPFSANLLLIAISLVALVLFEMFSEIG